MCFAGFRSRSKGLNLRFGKGFTQFAYRHCDLVCFIFIDGKKTGLHLPLYVSHLAACQILGFQIHEDRSLILFTWPSICILSLPSQRL